MTPPSTMAPPSPQLCPGHPCLQPGPGLWVWMDSGGEVLGATQQGSMTGRRACMGGRRGCVTSVSPAPRTVCGAPPLQGAGSPLLQCCCAVPLQKVPAHCTVTPRNLTLGSGEAQRLGQRAWWCLSFYVKCVQGGTRLLPAEPVGGRHMRS